MAQVQFRPQQTVNFEPAKCLATSLEWKEKENKKLLMEVNLESSSLDDTLQDLEYESRQSMLRVKQKQQRLELLNRKLVESSLEMSKSRAHGSQLDELCKQYHRQFVQNNDMTKSMIAGMDSLVEHQSLLKTQLDLAQKSRISLCQHYAHLLEGYQVKYKHFEEVYATFPGQKEILEARRKRDVTLEQLENGKKRRDALVADIERKKREKEDVPDYLRSMDAFCIRLAQLKLATYNNLRQIHFLNEQKKEKTLQKQNLCALEAEYQKAKADHIARLEEKRRQAEQRMIDERKQAAPATLLMRQGSAAKEDSVSRYFCTCRTTPPHTITRPLVSPSVSTCRTTPPHTITRPLVSPSVSTCRTTPPHTLTRPLVSPSVSTPAHAAASPSTIHFTLPPGIGKHSPSVSGDGSKSPQNHAMGPTPVKQARLHLLESEFILKLQTPPLTENAVYPNIRQTLGGATLPGKPQIFTPEPQSRPSAPALAWNVTLRRRFSALPRTSHYAENDVSIHVQSTSTDQTGSGSSGHQASVIMQSDRFDSGPARQQLQSDQQQQDLVEFKVPSPPTFKVPHPPEHSRPLLPNSQQQQQQSSIPQSTLLTEYLSSYQEVTHFGSDSREFNSGHGSPRNTPETFGTGSDFSDDFTNEQQNVNFDFRKDSRNSESENIYLPRYEAAGEPSFGFGFGFDKSPPQKGFSIFGDGDSVSSTLPFNFSFGNVQASKSQEPFNFFDSSDESDDAQMNFF